MIHYQLNLFTLKNNVYVCYFNGSHCKYLYQIRFANGAITFKYII